MSEYNFKTIEKKWQEIWEREGTFKAGGDPDPDRPEFYCLEMLPYPSGRLHMGHVRNYTIGDAVARFKACRGFQVLHPMGWDSFGLPAENAAIQRKIHPRVWTEENISQMRQQLKKLGYSYDWDREIAAHRPEYYRWNQWFFLKMYERGLAYRANRWVNWCGTCQTVLANEQVEGGGCWRCSQPVARRALEQWFLRITDYAEELDAFLPRLTGWPERVRQMQKNWIGKSQGALVRFSIVGEEESDSLQVYTTRLDTIFGATFVVLAPEHPALPRLAAGSQERGAVEDFLSRMEKRDMAHQESEAVEKEGVFTGRYAVNPYTEEKIPIWIGNFVLMEYGTGAIMAVPGNDQRDHEFAAKYQLPIRPVVTPLDPDARPNESEAFTEPGILVNSGPYDGQTSQQAMQAMLEKGTAKGFAEAAVKYRIRDWGVSRQRYWGTPIPMIHCESCGIVPVPEADLPVRLPEDVDLSAGGGSPLSRCSSFLEVPCPRCRKPARRETDTMDTFFDSSWYFYRYCDPKNDQGPFDARIAARWFPIDQYIGGITHAILHLIYCRFFNKVMRDLGLVTGDEPVDRLLNQGMVLMDGSAMSKSKGNVVEPDQMIDRFGADTTRLFTLFASPPEKDLEWNEQGLEGCHRFLERIWRLASTPWEDVGGGTNQDAPLSPREVSLRRKTHQTILRVTDDLDGRLHFNTAIAAIMELLNEASTFAQEPLKGKNARTCLREAVETMVQLLLPFAPHFAEEVWERLGNKERLSGNLWPVADPALAAAPQVEIVIQVNGRLRGKLEVDRDAEEPEVKQRALQDARVAAHLRDKSVVKTIFVPNRLLNIVVKG